MKKMLFFLAFVAIASFTAFGQTTKPTPPADDEVVKISTNLIQMDVTVTDKNGKTVSNLSPADFEVFENGEKQNITNFSFVSGIAAGATTGDAATAGANGPQKAGARLTQAQVRRTIAIVVDDLSLAFESVYYTREALRKFVNEQMQSGDLVAIVRTGGGIGVLQQFTSDKRILLAAIEKIRWNPQGHGGADAVAPVENDAQDITERTAADSNALAAMMGNPSLTSGRVRPNLTTDKAKDYNDTRNFNDFKDAYDALVTLNTIKYIISGMTELPGRKAMMLFSDGMKIASDSKKSRSDGTLSEIQKAIDAANRASVVVYTFDTRGLRSLGLQATDTNNEITEKKRDEKVAERLVNFQSSQDGLSFFADETGGKALLNSNDLNFGMERVLEEQSGYYLLAYAPDTDTFDAARRRFNKLEVKVKRPGLKASYRSGFFSTPGSDNSARAASVTTEQRMARALTSPFAANEIALNINALYADDPADGAYIRSFVHVDAKNLEFKTDAEGWQKATFDIAAVTFGDNGLPVDKKETTYTIKTRGQTYEAMLRKGFVYVLISPVKSAGVYQYRIALRDTATGRIGSASQIVEIPDVKKQRLTLSSLAVENVDMATWQNITQGRSGTRPARCRSFRRFYTIPFSNNFSPGRF
jgi:VWFA-related protein